MSHLQHSVLNESTIIDRIIFSFLLAAVSLLLKAVVLNLFGLGPFKIIQNHLTKLSISRAVSISSKQRLIYWSSLNNYRPKEDTYLKDRKHIHHFIGQNCFVHIFSLWPTKKVLNCWEPLIKGEKTVHRIFIKI